MGFSRARRALLLALSPLAIIVAFIVVFMLQATFIDEINPGLETLVNLVLIGPLVLLLSIAAVILSFTTGPSSSKVGPWTRILSVLSLLLTAPWAFLTFQIYAVKYGS